MWPSPAVGKPGSARLGSREHVLQDALSDQLLTLPPRQKVLGEKSGERKRDD